MVFTGYDYSTGLAALGQGLNNISKGFEQQHKQQSLAALGKEVQAGNFEGAAQKAFALGDADTGLGILKLGQAAKEKALQQEASRSFMSGFGGGAPVAQQNTAAAPVGIGNPNEIESRFIGGVRQAGLTNPVGLGAVAAYGRAESGFSPRNANRTWSDPSESGQAGQAGGIMSWRADRLRNLYSFAQQRGEQPGNISPETQAMFLAQEDPTLIPKLQAARTPEEANGIMAQAWRFAGYNRPGGENARRLAMTQHYASRFGQQPAAQPVQVAETEADVQRLEAQQAAQQAAPVQVAQVQGGPQADMPAPGAAPAQGYAIPQGVGSDIPPNDPAPRMSTPVLMRAMADPNLPQAQREMAKSIVERRLRYSDENSPIKTENLRLQNEKLRREVDGGGVRSLITPEERIAAGVDPAYKGTVQIDRDGKITYPGKASTEVNIGGEKSFDQTVGKAYGEQFVGLQKDARDSSKTLGTINMMEKLIQTPGFYSGLGGERSLAINRALVSLGIKDAKAATAQEAFAALSNQMVLDASGGSLGTGFSNADRDFIIGQSPNLANTPEGNRELLGMQRKIQERKQAIAKMARDYARENRGRIDAGFDDLVAQYAEANPLFPKTAAAAAPSAPTAAPAVGEVRRGYRYKGGDPANAASWEQAQ